MPARFVTTVCNTAGSLTWASSDAIGKRPSGVIPENEITQSPSKASSTCLTIGLPSIMPYPGMAASIA